MKIKLMATLGLFFTLSSSIYADEDLGLEFRAAVGEAIYSKYYEADCGFEAQRISYKHTTEEWNEIINRGEVDFKLRTSCPNTNTVDNKHLVALGNYFKFYAADSGQVAPWED